MVLFLLGLPLALVFVSGLSLMFGPFSDDGTPRSVLIEQACLTAFFGMATALFWGAAVWVRWTAKR